jgi:hypothetical protein
VPDADHTPPSNAEVKKELNYTSTHPTGPPGPVTGFPLPLHFSKPRIHLQEEVCTYRHPIGCFTCIRVSSLVGTRVCPVQTAYTDAQRTY